MSHNFGFTEQKDSLRFGGNFSYREEDEWSFKQIIELGCYGVVHPDVLEGRYPLDRKFQLSEISMIEVLEKISIAEAVRISILAGYHPAYSRQAFHFGIHHPKLQTQYSIIAPGTILRNQFGDDASLYLGCTHDNKRSIGSLIHVGVLYPGMRILVMKSEDQNLELQRVSYNHF